MNRQEKLRIWKEYLEELFEDDKTNRSENHQVNSGKKITKQKVIHSLKILKIEKAPGPKKLPFETPNIIEEEQIHILVNLFNVIY